MIIKVDTPNQKYAKKNDLPSCVYIYMCVCVRIIIMLWFCFCCLHAFYIRQEMCYASGVTPPVFKFPTFLTECTRGPSPQLYFDRRYNMFAISYGMYETCLDIFHVFRLSKFKPLGSTRLENTSTFYISLYDMEVTFHSTPNHQIMPDPCAWPRGLEGSCGRDTGTGGLPSMALIQVIQGTNFVC